MGSIRHYKPHHFTHVLGREGRTAAQPHTRLRAHSTQIPFHPFISLLMGLRLVFDTFPPLSHIYQTSRCCATQVSSETLKKGEGKIGPARRSRPCVLIFLLLLRHFSIPDNSFICSRSLLVAHAHESTISFSLSYLFHRLSVVPMFIFF